MMYGWVFCIEGVLFQLGWFLGEDIVLVMADDFPAPAEGNGFSFVIVFDGCSAVEHGVVVA